MHMHLAQSRKLKNTLSTFLGSLQCSHIDLDLFENLETASTGDHSVKNDLTSAILHLVRSHVVQIAIMISGDTGFKTTPSVSLLPSYATHGH